MTARERKLTPALLDHYKREGLRVRREALWQAMPRLLGYAVAPLALGRRICSPSRGKISTKLHGR
jgi:hypothetical protein